MYNVRISPISISSLADKVSEYKGYGKMTLVWLQSSLVPVYSFGGFYDTLPLNVDHKLNVAAMVKIDVWDLLIMLSVLWLSLNKFNPKETLKLIWGVILQFSSSHLDKFTSDPKRKKLLQTGSISVADLCILASWLCLWHYQKQIRKICFKKLIF